MTADGGSDASGNGAPGAAPIRVLASGLALGHFLPALAIARDLGLAGHHAQVEVYEEHLTPAQLETVDATRHAYHRNRRLARVGLRAAGALAPEPDPDAAARLAHAWERDAVARLIVLSGYWAAAVAEYARSRRPGDTAVEWCHVDTTVSPSWRKLPDVPGARHVWFGRADELKVYRRVRMSSRAALPFDRRERRVVAHGGGWGLGGYRGAVDDLLGSAYEIDLVSYGDADRELADGRVRRFRDDPSWRPWVRGPDGRFSLPRCSEVDGPEVDTADAAGVLERARSAYAIVSKPGGATLWDGLSTATPAVFAPSDAAHEAGNGRLWCHLGFGIGFDEWRAMDFSEEPLEAIHLRLLRALHEVPAYPIAGLSAVP